MKKKNKGKVDELASTTDVYAPHARLTFWNILCRCRREISDLQIWGTNSISLLII